MPRAIAKLTLRRKHSRRKRLAIGITALLAAAVATPFICTSSLVRFFLAHSSYRNTPIRFRSASLYPTGVFSLELTLHDVAIDDTKDAAGKPLLAASKVQVRFGLREVYSHRLRDIVLEDLDLTLRPGADTPLTLLRLLDTPSASEPWSFDQVLVAGKIRLEGYTPWMPLAQVRPGDPLPLQLKVGSTGHAANAQFDVSLIVGDSEAAARPCLSTRLSIKTTSDATTLAVDHLIVANMSPTVTEALWQAFPSLPEDLRRNASGHFDRVIASGTLTLGRENAINATVELRDLTAHSGNDLALEHLSAATHVEGRLSAAPLKDLKFTQTHCSWENAQWNAWRMQRGIADFHVDGSEIVLADLQATLADAELRAAGAFDTSTGVLSRGRVWFNNFAAAKVLAALPPDARHYLPVMPEGTLSARVFLSESDAAHLAAHVELVCPDKLLIHPAEAVPATANAATSPQATAPAAQATWAAATNMELSGTVAWNYQTAAAGIALGRLKADELRIVPWGAGTRAGSDGISVSKVTSDFSLQNGTARLKDFYASLPGDGRITAEAQYVLARHSLEHVVIGFDDVDAALANPWLPGAWTLTGQLNGQISGRYSPQEINVQASLGLAAQTVLQDQDAALTVTGSAPLLTLSGTYNTSTREAQIQTAEITGISAIQADDDLVRLARAYVAPDADSNAEAFFETLKTGAVVSFDELGFAGSVRLPPPPRTWFERTVRYFAPAAPPPCAAGTLTLNGLDMAASGAADTGPGLLNLTLKTGIVVPLPQPDWKSIRLTDGTFLAEKVTLSQNVFTALAGQVAVDNGQARVTHGRLDFAGGSVETDAMATLPGQLDSLHLTFKGLHQEVLTRAFYPDVVTAEGPVSGTLTLEGQNGVITMEADEAGRLKISREASKSTFAPMARAAMEAQDTILPSNFEDIVVGQLADYPYDKGGAEFQDSPKGMTIVLHYARPSLVEGDPGYGVPVTIAGQKVNVSLPLQIRGYSITLVDFSIRKLLKTMVSARDNLLAPVPRPASRPKP